MINKPDKFDEPTAFRCTFHLTMHERIGDPIDFVSEYTGELFVPRAEDDDLDDGSEDELAGKARVYVINAEAAEQANIALFDVLDYEASTAVYLSLLDENSDSGFIPAVEELLNDELIFTRNMLLLDRLEILPSFRGRNIGLEFMRACIERFGIGCRIAALKPFPLQFEVGAKKSTDPWTKTLKLKAFSGTERAATKKLQHHYARAGFVRVKGTDLMIRGLHGG